MNYLNTIASILCTLLSIISLYFITTTAINYYDEYKDTQRLKSKLHPEVTIDDIKQDDGLLYVSFDKSLTQMVMNNEESERQEPIQLMTMEYEEDEDD